MFRWRKHRASGGDRAILVPDYLESTPHEEEKRSNFSQTAMWIGAISQATMLLVVLFGYIYTVRPAFQHQLLQEKLASAELNRMEVEEQITILQAARYEAESALHAVQRQVASVEADRERLEAELQEVSSRAFQAQNDASRLEGIVQEQLDELEDARWGLLMIDFSFGRMLFGRSELTRDPTEREGFLEYLQRYREEWPDPFEALRSAITSLRDRNASDPRYPESYIDEFDEFIESRKTALTCVAPPYDNLEDVFRERNSKIEAIVEEKTDKYLDNLVSEYRERGQRVSITEDLRNRTVRLYRVTEELNLERELKDEVREYLDKCRLAAQNVVSEFRNLKGVTR